MAVSKLIQDPKWLQEQYVDNEKTIDQLAQMCNVDRKVIINALNNFQIYRKYNTDKHPKRW
jgi:predicted transcriptional regulator